MNNEVKKILYKENPRADLIYIRQDGLHYHTHAGGKNIFFQIPFNDIQSASFLSQMDAKYLIRWIIAGDA